MEESFLHYLWQHKLLGNSLETTSGDPVFVESPGQHNINSGPDFLTAKVRVGDTLWAGNVEIHVKSSDWLKHRHQFDPAYQNIILHVVYNNDTDLGINAPTLSVKSHVNTETYNQYIDLINNKNWVPCELLACYVDHFTWAHWKERLLVERLEKKYSEIDALLQKFRNSWEEAFYVSIARNFGLSVNAGPFELLAKATPLKVLAKSKQNIVILEALLFGQAGLLEDSFKDAYPKLLQKEYEHQRKKWGLQPIDAKLWRFLRLRPANFPHIRIAQFAQLIHKSTSLFSYIREATQLGDISNLFIVKASEYWNNHYRFDKKTESQAKFLGKSAINLLLINTIIPYLFAYGKNLNKEAMQERALNYLTEIPAEKNHIISHWESMGIKSEHAFHTQALIYLKKSYCIGKRCLQCPIGKKILS